MCFLNRSNLQLIKLSAKNYLPKFQNSGASFSFVFRNDSRDESDKSQFTHRVSISVCLSV